MNVLAALAAYGPTLLSMLSTATQFLDILKKAAEEGRETLTPEEEAQVNEIVETAEKAYFGQLQEARDRLNSAT